MIGKSIKTHLISITLIYFSVDECKAERYHKIFQISSVRTKNRNRFRDHHIKKTCIIQNNSNESKIDEDTHLKFSKTYACQKICGNRALSLKTAPPLV